MDAERLPEQVKKITQILNQKTPEQLEKIALVARKLKLG